MQLFPSRGFRKVERKDYVCHIAKNSAARYGSCDHDNAVSVTVDYDRTGNLIAEAVYGTAPRAIYRIKVAH